MPHKEKYKRSIALCTGLTIVHNFFYAEMYHSIHFLNIFFYLEFAGMLLLLILYDYSSLLAMNTQTQS